MSEEYGSDYLSLTDDEGNELELEVVCDMDYNGSTYVAFLPTDMSEDDPDYGYVILRLVEENGEELFETIDDEAELQDVYEKFMILICDEEEED